MLGHASIAETPISALPVSGNAIAAKFPSLTGGLEGYTDSVGSIISALSVLSGSISGRTEIVGDVEGFLPRLVGSLVGQQLPSGKIVAPGRCWAMPTQPATCSGPCQAYA